MSAFADWFDSRLPKEVAMSRRETMWLTANVLSLIRLLLAPAVLVCLILSSLNVWLLIVALTLFTIASLLDYVDGKIARSWDQVSVWGAFIDPLADKTLVAFTLVGIPFLYWGNWLAMSAVWLSLILVAWREIDVTIRFRLRGKLASAKMSGKVKTTVQMITIIAWLVAFPLAYDVFSAIRWVLLIAMCLITVYSWEDYYRKFNLNLKEV